MECKHHQTESSVIIAAVLSDAFGMEEIRTDPSSDIGV